MLITDIIKATKIAAPNEEKPKLADPTKVEVKFSIKALMTKLKSPNVSSVNGNEIILKIGLINAFKIERTKLATNAIMMLRTWTMFGNNTARATKVSVFIINR